MFQPGETSSSTSVDMPVRLVDTKGKILESTQQVVHFSGQESFEEAFAIGKSKFPDRDVVSMKLGKLHAEAITTFNNMKMREYMRKNRMKPSATCLYVITAAAEVKPPKRARKRKDSDSQAHGDDDSRTSSSESEDSDDGEEPNLSFQKVTKILESDIEKLEEIGSGTQARVYKGKWQGTDVALKETFLQSPQLTDAIHTQLLQEIALHSDLAHPNVVQFFLTVQAGTVRRHGYRATSYIIGQLHFQQRPAANTDQRRQTVLLHRDDQRPQLPPQPKYCPWRFETPKYPDKPGQETD